MIGKLSDTRCAHIIIMRILISQWQCIRNNLTLARLHVYAQEARRYLQVAKRNAGTAPQFIRKRNALAIHDTANNIREHPPTGIHQPPRRIGFSFTPPLPLARFLSSSPHNLGVGTKRKRYTGVSCGCEAGIRKREGRQGGRSAEAGGEMEDGTTCEGRKHRDEERSRARC